MMRLQQRVEAASNIAMDYEYKWMRSFGNRAGRRKDWPSLTLGLQTCEFYH